MSRTKTYRPSETLASKHYQQPQPNEPRASDLHNSKSKPGERELALSPTEAQLAHLLTLPPFSSQSVIFILWYTLTTNLSSPVIASLHNATFAPSISSRRTDRATEWTVSDVRLHAIRVVCGGQFGNALLEVPRTAARCPCYFGIDCKRDGVKKRRERGEDERADLVLARMTWDVDGDADLVECPIRSGSDEKAGKFWTGPIIANGPIGGSAIGHLWPWTTTFAKRHWAIASSKPNAVTASKSLSVSFTLLSTLLIGYVILELLTGISETCAGAMASAIEIRHTRRSTEICCSDGEVLPPWMNGPFLCSALIVAFAAILWQMWASELHGMDLAWWLERRDRV